ncbi:uncharacterized protein LOC120358427 isoform X3 [Solenopsis invicta]|uniref:uncharacterized protein LOC120358427 isoform X3 n=1 Tax=Solenopsis invicta TaxID=13686 RepID=UPI000E33EC50|nr:uncharacterized protein LOC120358427 isoform X3 [Solenopsis invicta]
MASMDYNNKLKNDKDQLQQNHEEHTEVSIPSILTSITTTFQSTDQVGEITEDYENFISTSAVLHYCKHKILRPYLRLLGVMGLRPTSSDDSDHFLRCSILANFHTVQVTIFICIGYILQYMACFRRDRGFCYKVLIVGQNELEVDAEQTQSPSCYGNVIFSYLIPSVLHLVAYLYTIYLFRVKENEQLQNLMERAFLLSSNPINRGNQKRLVHILWLFIALSIVWMIMALITVNIQMAERSIVFQWVENSPYQVKITLKIFLIVCTLWHDMVQGTIITSYCLQGQLLMSHLYFLRGKLLQHVLLPIDWMRAARLTNACSMIRAVGHEIRIRPFVYQATPGEDLDSILLYTSSLKMCARLFRIPIKGRYLCLLLTISSISVLSLGQCQFFS